MSAFERFLDGLDRVKRSGHSKATARCPAHKDKVASLSVSAGLDGRVLVKCHAGCSSEEIVAARGMALADLFERSERLAPRSTSRRSRAGNFADVDRFHHSLLVNGKALARLEGLRGWTREAVERLELGFDGERVVFPIRNWAGELVGLGRYQPNGDRRSEDEPKMKADAGSRRELFPRPEAVEGEPDAVRAASLGLSAVAVPGVEGWRPEYRERFRGRRVVVCFDCDAQGREAAARVAADLLGAASEVRLLDLDPAANDGFDLTDFAAKAASASERAETRRILERCAEMAPLYEPAAENPFPRNGKGVERVSSAKGGEPVPDVVKTPEGGLTVGTGHRLAVPDARERDVLQVLTARELCALPDPPQTDELLGSLVVRGQRIVIGAHTGEGKTTMALQLVRAIVAGEDFLDWKGTAGCRALVIDAEQGLKTIKRRLREAGLCDSDLVDYVRVPDGLELDRDEAEIDAVEQLLAAGEYAVVLADPLYKLHGGNSNDEREAVNLMRRFDGWRERFGFALPLPVHLRKPIPGEKFSIHDVFGSSAYVRGAEVVLGLRRVSNGFAELHFFKDRDGDLAVGDKWGLLFDRESGYRRAPEEVESEEEMTERLLAFVRENPGQSTTKVTDAVEGRKAKLTRILRNDDRFRSERRGQSDLWFEAGPDLLTEEEPT